MNNPFLSICIPSYQRKDAVKRLYSEFILKVIAIFDDVEICFSDNCSDYDVFEVVKPSEQVKVIRQSTNIGYDGNLLESIKLASGKYVLFVGNDDLVDLDNLSLLLNYLKNKQDDVTFLNYSVKDGEEIKATYKYTSQEQVSVSWVLKRLNEKITFFSSFVIIRELLNLSSVKKYIGKNFIHIALLFDVISRNHKISFFDKSITTAIVDHNIDDKNEWNYYNLFIKDLGFIIKDYSLQGLQYFKNCVFSFVMQVAGISDINFKMHGYSTFIIDTVLTINTHFSYQSKVGHFLIKKMFKINSMICKHM